MPWVYWCQAEERREELIGPFRSQEAALVSRQIDEEDGRVCSGIYYSNEDGSSNSRFGGKAGSRR